MPSLLLPIPGRFDEAVLLLLAPLLAVAPPRHRHADRRRQPPHAGAPSQARPAPRRPQRQPSWHDPSISFDVFLQPFHDGDAAIVDAAAVLEALTRFSNEPVTPDSRWIRTTDGEAQVFGLDNAARGFMINHASGRAIWDTIIQVADVTGMTILPIGCPTCVTRTELLEHLPEELRPDARVVTSGEQLVAAFN